MNFDAHEARRIMMSSFFKSRKYLEALTAETGLEAAEIMSLNTSKNIPTEKIATLFESFQKIEPTVSEELRVEQFEKSEIFAMLK